MPAEQPAQVVGIQQGGGRTLVTVQHERPAAHLHTFPSSRLPALPDLGVALTLTWLRCPKGDSTHGENGAG